MRKAPLLTTVLGGGAGYTVNPQGSVIMPIGAYDSANTNTTGQIGTSFYTIEAEAPFIGVRIWLMNSLTTGRSGHKVIVAPTETAVHDDISKSYYPYQSGARNDALWKTVKYRGRASVTPNVGAGTVVAAGQLVRPGPTRSDYLPCQSIARADSGSPNRHLLKVRIFNGNGAGSIVYNAATGGAGGYNGGNKGSDFDRVIQAQSTHSVTQAGFDGVADVTMVPLDGAGGNVFASVGGQPILTWLAVEFVYATATRRTVLAMGDSITTRYSSYRFGQDHWLAKSILGASDPTEPITFINGGLNGRNSTEWLPWFSEMLATGWYPTDVLMSSFEVNDDINGGNSLADVRHAAESVILDTCASLGIRAWLWTPQPRDTYNTTQDAVRLYSDQWARDQVTALRASLVDFRSVLGDGATPERFIAGLGIGDGIHPGPLGGDAMTTLFKPLLMSTHAPRVIRDVGIIGQACNSGTVYAVPALVSAKPAVSGRTYQWKRDGVNIGAATASSYSPVAGDYTHSLTVVETITNAQGSVTSTSTGVTVSATAPTVAVAVTNDYTALTLTNLTTSAGPDVHPLTATATNLVAETATATVPHSIAWTGSVAGSGAGTSCTFWCLVAYTQTRQFIQMSASTAAFNSGWFANFDIASGRVSKAPTNGSARMVPVWIGAVLYWYCEMTATTTAGNSKDPQVWILNSGSANRRSNSYTGVITNTFEFAQIQFENTATKWASTIPSV